jgi:hypothetical protein
MLVRYGTAAMTRDEALDLAVHIYGTSACCERCQTVRYFDDYKAARPDGVETDFEFGQWLLQEGWQFAWEEDENGGWTFEFQCPVCAAPPGR